MGLLCTLDSADADLAVCGARLDRPVCHTIRARLDRRDPYIQVCRVRPCPIPMSTILLTAQRRALYS